MPELKKTTIEEAEKNRPRFHHSMIRVTLEHLDENGTVRGAFTGCHPNSTGEHALACALARAIDPFMKDIAGPFDANTEFVITNLMYLMRGFLPEPHQKLADAFERWSCVNDLDDCVTVTIDEKKLTAE